MQCYSNHQSSIYYETPIRVIIAIFWNCRAVGVVGHRRRLREMWKQCKEMIIQFNHHGRLTHKIRTTLWSFIKEIIYIIFK